MTQSSGNEPKRTIRIDEDLKSYETFFDYAWSRGMDQIASGTALADPVFSLCLSWKGTGGTFALPSTIIGALKGQGIGLLRDHEPTSLKTIRFAADRAATQLRHIVSAHKCQQVASSLRKIGEDTYAGLKTSEVIYDEQWVWRGFLSIPDFRIWIWELQRNCYSALFYAYENFIRECIGVWLDKPDFRIDKFKVVCKEATAIFGVENVEFCIKHPTISTAKLVRNAIAHAGGTETEDLKGGSHGFQVDGGMLQILANDTRTLFNELKERVSRMVIAGTANPKLCRGAAG